MSTKRWWENFESPWFWLKFRNMWLKWRKAWEKSKVTPVSEETLDEISSPPQPPPPKKQNFGSKYGRRNDR